MYHIVKLFSCFWVGGVCVRCCCFFWCGVLFEGFFVVCVFLVFLPVYSPDFNKIEYKWVNIAILIHINANKCTEK